MEEYPKEHSGSFSGGQLSDEAAAIVTKQIVTGYKVNRVLYRIFSLAPLLAGTNETCRFVA